MGKVIKLASWEFRPIVQLAQWVMGQENLEQATEGRGVEFGAQHQKGQEPP